MIVLLTATDRLGADPANCVYVGDGADGELAGGTAVGLTRRASAN
jgi:putative hydrolase of the HAD superfamily